jgi:hypothetical protein
VNVFVEKAKNVALEVLAVSEAAGVAAGGGCHARGAGWVAVAGDCGSNEPNIVGFGALLSEL